MQELPKAYDPKVTEDKIYKLWEESGFFNSDNLPTTPQRPFCILMPPTNANGSLHAGHALVLTIEDIMTRYQRMRGRRALWLPGLDHAGFETQIVYEKQLEKEGRSRFQMEPKQLYEEILNFTLQNKKNIEDQTKKIGASCDWSRERFTLDDSVVKTVYRTFKKLADNKLLYRGKRIVNWCPKHQTSLSELETVDEERTDPLYYFQYGPFVIATARPETKFGDKYVVMHPDDPRYAAYTPGQTIELEWINGPLTATVIKDSVIDQTFGTGVMTITPAHDATDFEIAQRHKLDKPPVIDQYGKLLPIAGEFAGMKISEAREKIVEKLKAKGLLVKIDERYKHAVKKCYKCNSLIEPQIKAQWFVQMAPLAKPAIQAIEQEQVTFIPEHYKKISLHWLNNITDWNISRQIVWGIPIPAKLCAGCGAGQVDLDNTITNCPDCGGTVQPDPDTFDTWFSSGQWPFAALGHPASADFKNFYPTDVMETAGEIIFFWVARMLMLGLYVTGQVPFRTVYLHGLVLDGKGQKMSKSKGNVINPLTLTDKYGTDALRMGLVVGNTPGTSLALAKNKIKGYQHFANKIWNASRFVLMNLTSGWPEQKPTLTSTDQTHLAELATIIAAVTEQLDNYKFYLAAEQLYHYFWHTFADKIIEEKKADLACQDDPARQTSARWLLAHTLTTCLKLLHPFVPFVTEAIYTNLLPAWPGKKLLIVEEWPSQSRS